MLSMCKSEFNTVDVTQNATKIKLDLIKGHAIAQNYLILREFLECLFMARMKPNQTFDVKRCMNTHVLRICGIFLTIEHLDPHDRGRNLHICM